MQKDPLTKYYEPRNYDQEVEEKKNFWLRLKVLTIAIAAISLLIGLISYTQANF